MAQFFLFKSFVLLFSMMYFSVHTEGLQANFSIFTVNDHANTDNCSSSPGKGVSGMRRTPNQ